MSFDLKKDSSLGKIVKFSENKDRSLLQEIERNLYRSKLINSAEQVKNGYDNWCSFEVSCLDSNENVKVFWLSFNIPASSKFIVESKSLKLYLSSLFNEKFNSKEELANEITSAIEEKIGDKVEEFRLISNNEWGLYLQNNFSFQEAFPFNIKLGQDEIEITDNKKSELLVYHGFRSLCPVTSQPDYATVVISYQGYEIEKNSLATYFQSYRNSEGFHEYWTEKLFLEILEAYKKHKKEEPKLELKLFFARRGGISINPSRSTKSFYNSLPSLKFLR